VVGREVGVTAAEQTSPVLEQHPRAVGCKSPSQPGGSHWRNHGRNYCRGLGEEPTPRIERHSNRGFQTAASQVIVRIWSTGERPRRHPGAAVGNKFAVLADKVGTVPGHPSQPAPQVGTIASIPDKTEQADQQATGTGRDQHATWSSPL